MRKRPSSVEDVFAIRSPAEYLTFGAMLVDRQKIEEEKLRKEEEQQKRKVDHPAEKSKKRAKTSVPHVKTK